ncbi:MAG: 3-phosphoshikimate 1-carboxyvinyltransferase [Arenimonas sp.]
MNVDWLAGGGSPLHGSIRVPGDKSISHRAVMLAAIAQGQSRISGFLEGEDTRASARILGQLGVRIDSLADGERVVSGVGLHGLAGSDSQLDCGNAGTGMRLLAGLLAGQNFSSCLVGDESLSTRPMGRIIVPLTAMGAKIESGPHGRPPLIIHANNVLQAIDFTTPIPSAQLKSAILLAALYAHGITVVREPQPTRDYTERMLAAFGWPVEFSPGHVRLSGGHILTATEVAVPADFSSAAFFIVAATIVPGSDLKLTAVGMNPRRTGLLQALRLMGADIVEESPRQQGGEIVADLRVRFARLRGADIPSALVPDMIDEFPALFVAAAVAEGSTRVTGASELRVKESDRLAVMTQALVSLGAKIEETPDGAIIQGGTLRGGQANSHGDHRIAMSLAVAAQLASGEVRILDCANVATSFPDFPALASSSGFGLKPAQSANAATGPA